MQMTHLREQLEWVTERAGAELVARALGVSTALVGAWVCGRGVFSPAELWGRLMELHYVVGRTWAREPSPHAVRADLLTPSTGNPDLPTVDAIRLGVPVC